MNKPLIAAGALVLCALAFLLYCWHDFRAAAVFADDAEAMWTRTATQRRKVSELRQQLAAEAPQQAAKNAVDATAVFGELLKECEIHISQLKIEAGRAGPGEQSRHIVRIAGVRLNNIGKLLEKMRTKYPYLQAHSIEMRAIQQKPEEFNWVLDVAVAAERS